MAEEAYPPPSTLDVLRQNEDLSRGLLGEIDQRIEALEATTTSGDYHPDTQYNLEDLRSLRMMLDPATQQENVVFETHTRRDGTVITFVANVKNLDANGSFVLPKNSSALRPIHTLEIVNSLVRRDERRDPARLTVEQPVRQFAIYDCHRYRGPDGRQPYTRPSLGLLLKIYGDNSLEVSNTLVDAVGNQYEDPRSRNRSLPNYGPAIELLASS